MESLPTAAGSSGQASMRPDRLGTSSHLPLVFALLCWTQVKDRPTTEGTGSGCTGRTSFGKTKDGLGHSREDSLYTAGLEGHISSLISGLQRVQSRNLRDHLEGLVPIIYNGATCGCSNARRLREA